MTQNAYIHIPFCKSKCNYCSFVSFPELKFKEQYIAALISQIKSEYKGELLNTLYFGGGTPSILTLDEFKTLIELFNFEKDAEITTEVNPDSVDFEYLQGLRQLGINRISIGSQSFDDEILKLIGRRHNSEQIKSAVNYAKNAGFANISLDFIYGLPTQTLQSFESDLKTAIDLGVQHISLYGLKIEEGCYFYKNQPEEIADLDEQADMYLKAIETLKTASFEHYEISNFSKCEHHCDPESSSGRRVSSLNSRHNLNYWDNNSYYGFGCSASGYTDGIRYTNQDELAQYITSPLSKIYEQQLSESEILEESIFLGFRKLSGINTNEINQKFGIDFNKKYAKILDKFLETGHFIKTEKGYALSTEGVLVSNEILSEFITL